MFNMPIRYSMNQLASPVQNESVKCLSKTAEWLAIVGPYAMK